MSIASALGHSQLSAPSNLSSSSPASLLCSTPALVLCSYTALVKEAFNPAGAGRGLFFSFDADVTLTQQRCDLCLTAIKH